METEYRVLATEKRGWFKCFGPDREAAEWKLGLNPEESVFPGSRGKLQYRDSSIQGDDSTWIDLTAKETARLYEKNKERYDKKMGIIAPK